jgi:hypothetical protein
MTYPYQSGPPEPTPPPPDPPVPAYQEPNQQYQQPAYYHPQPMYPYGYQPPRPTEGLAIASLVVSCAGVLSMCAYGLGGILGVVGAILGHAARRRISRNGSQGAGMALAGIIVGWIMTALTVVIVIILVVVLANDPEFTET